MGIAERKEREREEVKDLILNAAREIFLKDGYESTSIRKIAKRIEYSPGIIYHHFKDKNDLLLALHDKAFECKINALFTSVQHIADPAERLRATGIGYIEYGLSNPQDYELMFILRCPMEALALKEEFWQDGAASIEVLKQNIRECIESGYFRSDVNVDDLSLVLWSQVHGLVSLHNHERLNIYPGEDKKQFLIQSFELFYDMLIKSLKPA